MAHWSYKTCGGPENWEKDFPEASGTHQSPINIITDNTQFDPTLAEDKLQFIVNPEQSKHQILNFTGHNFKIDTSIDSMIMTGVPGLKGNEFKLAQFHFHWGDEESDEGSEHQINGKGWASELHLVHYNSTKYPTFCEAADKPDGLVVLGVFFKIGKRNEDIQKLLESLKDIQRVKSVDLETRNSSVDIQNLLPKNTDRYFTYPGSLTTPPCNESVTWIVFEEPLTISSKQLAHFRKVHNDECGASHNNRPVCLPNDREVKRSFETVH